MAIIFFLLKIPFMEDTVYEVSFVYQIYLIFVNDDNLISEPNLFCCFFILDRNDVKYFLVDRKNTFIFHSLKFCRMQIFFMVIEIDHCWSMNSCFPSLEYYPANQIFMLMFRLFSRIENIVKWQYRNMSICMFNFHITLGRLMLRLLIAPTKSVY